MPQFLNLRPVIIATMKFDINTQLIREVQRTYPSGTDYTKGICTDDKYSTIKLSWSVTPDDLDDNKDKTTRGPAWASVGLL